MLEDLKATLDVWNALKHAPATDVLFAVGLHALYRAMKRLLSMSWKPKPWTFNFFTNDLHLNARYDPKDKHNQKGKDDPKSKSKTKKTRRAKIKAGHNTLITHTKTTPTLPSPKTPRSLPSDKNLPSND